MTFTPKNATIGTMNVHISPEKIQEYETTRQAHDDAWEDTGGAVRGVDQILRLTTPEQVSYAENEMQHDFDTRDERASQEAEFLDNTSQGETISFYLEGLAKCVKVLSRSKRIAEDATGSPSDTQSGQSSGARVVTAADLAENAEKNAVINFAREVQLGGFGLPSGEQFKWLHDSQARLQEMIPSLAQNPRYEPGETVNVLRNARDGYDAYFESDWKIAEARAGIAANGYFLVEKGVGPDAMHKEVAIQDLDAWNGFPPDQGVA